MTPFVVILVLIACVVPPPPAADLPKIPPVPAIPGAPLPPESDGSDAEAELTPEQRAAHQAEADASPRRSNFSDHRETPKPTLPPAPVRRRQEIHLTPSEAMIVDRGAMSESLRIQRSDLRVPSGFTSIYEVEQRPDVLVRANGAVYAVFPQGDYALAKKRKKWVIQTLVPAGTMFYIGEPNWRRVWLPGIRGMAPKLRLMSAEEFAAQSPPASSVNRIEPTMPHDYSGVYIVPFMMEDHPGIGLISTRIDTFIDPVERAFGTVPMAQMNASSSESIRHPVLAPAVDAKRAAAGDGIAPPIHTDSLYRRGRLTSLLERAAQRGTDAPSRTAE